MGTSTAGIAHAAITAHILDMPMGYVRSGAKDHGRNNQIEGKLEKGQKVVVVEDLISTGGSVVEVVNVLREAGANVLGIVSIFTYNMEKGKNRLKDANVKNTTIANYVILSGKYGSKDINEKISFEMVNVPYDIEKELSKNTDNIEKDLYEEELRSGKYRNMEKIYKSFELRGIDINKI